MQISSMAKAIVGFITPGVIAIGGALTEASDGGTRITTYEIVAAIIACLVTGAAVFGVPNQPYVKREQDPAMENPAP